MLIVVVGIPGVGKSTVLEAILRKCPSTTIVNYGDVMVQEAMLSGIDRDTLQKMPIKKQQEMGKAAAVRIASEARGVTIVDTHACIRTEIGYCPVLPLQVLEVLQPQALVLITCSPLLIIKRRERDGKRMRDEENIPELTLYQELAREYLVACSTLTGAPLCIVHNDSDAVSHNIRSLVRLIESLS